MSAPRSDPEGVYVISRGDLMSGIAAADDPVVQWLWSQLTLAGTADPLDPPPLHRVALGYPSSADDPPRRGAPDHTAVPERERPPWEGALDGAA